MQRAKHGKEEREHSGQDEEVVITFHHENNLIPVKYNYIILASS